MKERLVQLLDMEQLSPSKFADIISVQRSSVSHVISGRNKPSFDFLQKTLKAFPGLNADWLILGEGTMYEQMGRGGSGNLFESSGKPVDASFPEDIYVDDRNTGDIADFEKTPEEYVQADNSEPTRTDPKLEAPGGTPEMDIYKRVVQVMVFYDDDTFKSFNPSQ